MHKLHENIKIKQAWNPVSVATGGSVTPIVIDCSGFDRAAVVIGRGTQTGATKNTLRVTAYKSAASGGTYTKMTGSDGTLASTASSKAGVLVDLGLDTDKPFIKVYGTGGGLGTSAFIVSGHVMLYRGSTTLPPSQEIAFPVILA